MRPVVGVESVMERPKFDAHRHISYWQRCLKSLLPTDYTSTDSSRVLLGFFILAALDILGAGVETLPPLDVEKLRAWILSCQHPNGGFCGSPNHKYPDDYYDEFGRREIDPANLPATYFAILSLSYVGGLRYVNRIKCLRWLKTVQRGDGSFGELVMEDGTIMGGRDLRYCHFAAGVRWMLRGDLGSAGRGSYEDVEVDGMVKHIRSGETYEGGIGESSRHESHAGYTYCAIASLSYLNRMPITVSQSSFEWKPPVKQSSPRESALTNVPGIIRWLLSRPVEYTDSVDEDEDSIPPSLHMKSDSGPLEAGMPPLSYPSLNESLAVGYNGRANKSADTCYCYYVTASLEILGQGSLIDVEGTRRYLLEQTQHRIGGFGKQSGYPPDLYHSYLGLATLAMMKEPGLKEVNPVLCASVQTKEMVEKEMNEILIPVRSYWKNCALFFSSEADPDHAELIAGDEGPPQYVVEATRSIKE